MNNIEQNLYLYPGWIPARILAADLGMTERALRGIDSPIRDFAISGDKGYRHLANATPEEINHFCARLTLHATEELKRVARIKEIRKNYEEDCLPLFK